DAIKSNFSKYRRGINIQNSKIRKPTGIELTSQRTGIVAVFMHKGGPQEPAKMTLYANGHINSLDSPATWSRFGNRLTLRWPTKGAPGGVWIDSCKLSPDGKTFNGVNQSGYAIHGWHVSGDIFSQKSF
ncbi:MAG: hypothetical protein CMJ74_09070, partial [Planctomycetaceae bacterium]|nr:hypothetical protein [Planctomycetaceae bacterium]